MKPTKPRGAPLIAISVATAAFALACSETTPNGIAPPTTEKASETDAAYRGAAISRQVCAQCHDIGDGSAPAIYSKAPTFKTVMEKPETTADGLTRWLQSSHPSMPHYVFPESEVTDIVAYMMSLKGAAP